MDKLLDSGVARILIKRKSSLLNLIVYLSKPNIIFKDNKFDILTQELSSLLKDKYNSYLNSWNIIEVVNPDACSSLLAEFVKQQLEKRIAFRKVMKAAVLKAQQAGVKGVKIQITGRLNGTEIARTEWIREGRVPLHTLRANIDYCSSNALVFIEKSFKEFFIFKYF